MKKSGFTLAEVLITLVIIGVIAAMTVPSLMNNTRGQEYRAALKKAVSALNQSLTLHYALDGESAADLSGATNLANALQLHMNVLDSGAYNQPKGELAACTKGTNCFATTDGIVYYVSSHAGATCSSGTGSCGTIWVDVNGDRNPNKKTDSAANPKDQYELAVYSQKIVPGDTVSQAVMYNQESSSGS